ncbi:bifunctional hydroxymethylpyrimidine kinase/phosphomethylpyrimidine kinase [Legionella micdadei]|uniref:hydroxymethylpyrimidine kinase n=1 Tax=Legionella micdadei TaxID=451 RepID=A0A098GD02_LEGMI|nr:bifunctional hydroxy-methylpyrimidine kinase and hydroxy-phosphomethylpyrimidine kinase [Legionella micdadei]CEG59885.1 Hydroxymethylpyrimidine/phosphomethylpyrimidine kinase [Legionella micdadei]SCY52788.1 hydroxymethylpyrimidine/phosphomethylpyrimidine kinase [Legionella micdadei]
MSMRHKALSIAGFDGSGGAGIQADLKTFSAFGCYGMTVLTALPVQNTQGVRSCYELPLQAINEQLHAIFDDIRPDSIKIGMLFKREIVELVANFIGKYAQGIPIVLDPVTVAKSGDPLLNPDALDALKMCLIPQTTIITPNLPEAEALLGAMSSPDMSEMAQQLLALGTENVLLKGGHLKDHYSNDLFLNKYGDKYWLESLRIQSKNTHGTGCTLSAAIASCLALGFDVFEACQMAKAYISRAIGAAKDEKIGKGFGPVHHFYHLWPPIEKIKID